MTAAPKVSPNRPSRSTWRRRTSPLELQLLASDRKPDAKGFARGGLLSLVIHTTVIAGAIYATVSSRHTDASVKFDTALVMMAPQTPQHETPPPALEVPLKGFQTVTVPTLVPTEIPPVNLQEHFDPKDFTGVGVEGGVANGLIPSSDQVYSSDIVDQRPSLITSPPLAYPPLLREAGISGRVILQAVIDTAGRAEPGSIKVLESTSPAFEPSSKQWILKALFRPARMAGRAVRVIVNQEVDYTLTGASSPGR
jgi:hypothetical protein